MFTYPTFPDSSWDDTEIPSRKRRSSLAPQTVLADYPPSSSCLKDLSSSSRNQLLVFLLARAIKAESCLCLWLSFP